MNHDIEIEKNLQENVKNWEAFADEIQDLLDRFHNIRGGTKNRQKMMRRLIDLHKMAVENAENSHSMLRGKS